MTCRSQQGSRAEIDIGDSNEVEARYGMPRPARDAIKSCVKNTCGCFQAEKMAGQIDHCSRAATADDMPFFGEKFPTCCIPAAYDDKDTPSEANFAWKAQAMEDIHASFAVKKSTVIARRKEGWHFRNSGDGAMKIRAVGNEVDRMRDDSQLAKVGYGTLRQSRRRPATAHRTSSATSRSPR